MTRERWLQAIAIGAVLVAAVLTVPFRHLWDPDESRYAEVTREMLESRQLLVPQLYGAPYPHKPPLFFWAQAGLRICGVPLTAAAVLPALGSFIALLLLLPAFAARLGMERRAGMLASALLASSPLAVALSLGGRMDMPLTLLHTVALVQLAALLGVGTREPPTRHQHIAFWACVALGVLTKGPVALALPLLAGVAMWLLDRNRLSLRPVFVGWGPLLAAALILAWLVPAGIAGGADYLKDILVRQTADRMLASPYAHPQPFYFHLVTYPFTGLPWSPLVIVALIHAARARRRDAALFLALSVVTLMLTFSVISGKLIVYLLPMFPAAMLLAADALLRALKGVRLALVGASAGAVLMGLGLAIAPRFRSELADDPASIVVAGLAIAAPAAVALACSLRYRPAAGLTSAALVVTGVAFAAVALPIAARVLDPLLSVYRVARTVSELEPGPQAPLVYQDRYPGLSLYSDRSFSVVWTPDELQHALAARRWVVIEDKELQKLAPALRREITETHSVPHRRRILFVVRGR